MTLTAAELKAAIEKALQEMDGETGRVVEAVRPILAGNVKSGRIQRFVNEDPDSAAVMAYVERVARYHEACHEQVHELQVEKSAEAWEALYVLLQKWAYAFLRRRGFPARGDRYEHAVACAGEAAATILSTRFPFDVHFQRWAYVILQNICRRHIENHWNSRDALHNSPVDLNEWDDWAQNLAHPTAEEDIERIGLRHDLLEAITELASDARAEFILLYYFHQRTFAEIAEMMGRTTNALYKLHFDALEELRKIWQAKQDYNE